MMLCLMVAIGYRMMLCLMVAMGYQMMLCLMVAIGYRMMLCLMVAIGYRMLLCLMVASCTVVMSSHFCSCSCNVSIELPLSASSSGSSICGTAMSSHGSVSFFHASSTRSINRPSLVSSLSMAMGTGGCFRSQWGMVPSVKKKSCDELILPSLSWKELLMLIMTPQNTSTAMNWPSQHVKSPKITENLGF